MARKKHDTKITTDAAGAARRDQADPAAAAPETTPATEQGDALGFPIVGIGASAATGIRSAGRPSARMKRAVLPEREEK